MSKTQKSDPDQQPFWQMAIETWRSSGLSIRSFCKQEGLSEPAFYSWRKRLTNSQKANPEGGPPKPFIQVSLPQEKAGGFELVFASGHRLRMSSDVDSQVLTGVLAAVKQAKLC
jgi:transposase-like protein